MVSKGHVARDCGRGFIVVTEGLAELDAPTTPFPKFELYRYHQSISFRGARSSRVSKDGRGQGRATASFETPCFAWLLRMRSVGLNSTLRDLIGFLESIH
jgi:hypothetical protein